MIIIVAVVIGVCRVYTRQANLRRAVVVSNAPETATVLTTTTQNNASQAPHAFNPLAAYGGYATPAENTAPPSYPTTGYHTTGFPPTGYSTTGYPTTGYPTTGYTTTGYPTTGYTTTDTGYPTTGFPPTGYSTTGYPTTDYPDTGYPSAPPPYPA